ncbi:MAG: (2Fe-2S)-binding protein [bacterium]|jgi:carbon-monoxide dehydrogenase small subunit|nr:(2Fe-2S)-binding protein [bacterium]
MTAVRDVELEVNGRRHQLRLEARRTLADVLREDLRLTGTHLGCEHGVCGACTVLLDGEPVRSCLLFGVQAAGHAVETVESLAPDGELNALQRAFHEHHALQCGFCTPGILMSLTAALRERGTLSEAEAREHLAGSLCRCTGYQQIVDAVLSLGTPGEVAG